jgi:hypothetical protein
VRIRTLRDMTDNQTGLAIKSEFFILFLMTYLFFTKPMVTIDGGAPQALKWRERSFVPTSAGRHEVTVYTKPILWIASNKATASVDVVEGQTAALDYKAPLLGTLLFFAPGKLGTAAA